MRRAGLISPRKIYRNILASIEWVRALSAGTRDDATAMLFHLQQAEEYAGKLIPDVALLRASALRARSDFAALREAALRATVVIDRDKKMSPADKDYMRAFLWALCEPVSGSFADEERRMLTFDIARVDLSKVSRHNLMNFALLEHPEWQAQFKLRHHRKEPWSDGSSGQARG